MSEMKELRKDLGLTQVEAANIVGVSRRTYQTYESKNDSSDIYQAVINKLKEFGCNEKGERIISLKFIKFVARQVFSEYKEIKCAYLFGSYARAEAEPDSDVDFLVVVVGTMGLRFFELAAKLSERLGKEVDLVTHEQVAGSAPFLKRLLTEGIKVYG